MKGNYPPIGTRFRYYKQYPNKTAAKMTAKTLRKAGYKARVIWGSSSYKPMHGSMGWNVWTTKPIG